MTNYVLEGPKWASTTITWSLAKANYANQPAQFGSYFTAGEFETEIRAAFATWAGVANLHFVQVADAADVGIRVGLASFDGPYGTVGYTAFNYARHGSDETILPGVVVEFDSGERYTLVNGKEQIGGGVAFGSVALHEIGHALGLDHYTAGPAIMNPVASASTTSLTQSDIDGIRALYGPAATVSVAALVGASPSAGLSAVYRFYDTSTGDHFYTTSAAETTNILQTLATYKLEGVDWAVPDAGANTTDIFRFYDTTTRQHFFTSSVEERDAIIQTLATYHYEGVAFQAYKDASAPGAITLERFYNAETGLHHYSASAGETADIKAGHVGTGWIDEGPTLIVHAPTAEMLLV